VHWENDPGDEPPQGLGSAPVGPAVPSYLQALPEPQWFNCDVRNFDWSILGKFGVIMTDPPWHIRQVSSDQHVGLEAGDIAPALDMTPLLELVFAGAHPGKCIELR
jgi:hypothetical protein